MGKYSNFEVLICPPYKMDLLQRFLIFARYKRFYLKNIYCFIFNEFHFTMSHCSILRSILFNLYTHIYQFRVKNEYFWKITPTGRILARRG